MKTQRNILIAFILNFSFSLFELIGGLLIGSVAILSDALHDLGDAVSIGFSFFLEKKSSLAPDDSHTYGYARYSVLGGFITTAILLLGSLTVVYNAVVRIIRPAAIHYDGMILFALVGAAVNLAAAFFTRQGDSLNQKAVNLHMLEDVLGWLVVLVGAVIMRFTDIRILDPLMSIGVAVFIFLHSLGNLKRVGELFLVKTPGGLSPSHLQAHLLALEGILDIHHIHVWSIDGQNAYATMHVVTDGAPHAVKERLRRELATHGIGHVTLELESPGEPCHERTCRPARCHPQAHSHCHHH